MEELEVIKVRAIGSCAHPVYTAGKFDSFPSYLRKELSALQRNFMLSKTMKFSLVYKQSETSLCHLAMEGKFLTVICIIMCMLLFKTKIHIKFRRVFRDILHVMCGPCMNPNDSTNQV